MKYRLSVFNWKTLYSFQTARFINSMYIWVFIVPVLAKAFSKIESSVKINAFGHDFEIDLSLPFSWQLFFICAVCFGIANIITILCSPKIIKDHSSLSDFLAMGKLKDHLDKYREDIGIYIDSDEIYFNRKPKGDEQEEIKAQEKYIKDQFWLIYNKANLYKPVARLFGSAFYVLGGGLLLFVLGSNILWVGTYIIEKW